MEVTATDAKNRLGQMLERCQREPVVIEKNGRRHSVLISADYFDALLATSAGSQASAVAGSGQLASAGQVFYGRYKDWVDQQNALVVQAGIPGEEFRAW